MNRSEVEQSLAIPSKYFQGRGISPDTLKEFCVGDCTKLTAKMRKRAVVPYFNKQGVFLGCTGRAIESPKQGYPKWKNLDGFFTSAYLYNYDRQPKTLDTVFVVESPKDVWLLYEAGIHNAVGVAGAQLSSKQAEQIRRLKVKHVVVFGDLDKAGYGLFHSVSSQLKNDMILITRANSISECQQTKPFSYSLDVLVHVVNERINYAKWDFDVERMIQHFPCLTRYDYSREIISDLKPLLDKEPVDFWIRRIIKNKGISSVNELSNPRLICAKAQKWIFWNQTTENKQSIDWDEVVDHIPDLLDNLGLTYYKRGNKIRLACPVHNGIQEHNCQIFLNTGIWQCYSNGCHKDGKTFMHFVQAVKQCNVKEAITWIKENL